MLSFFYFPLLNRRTWIIFLMGFSSGVPIALIGGTLQAWMVNLKIDLTLIGVFSLVGLPYTLKFLWAPLMDRYVPPFLGRRRGWMLITQLCLIGGLISIAFCNPLQSPFLLALLALCVSFSSASQDIVVDAYKTEILDPKEFGFGAAAATLGYRLAMLFSGAFALILSDTLSWQSIYLLMAGSISVGILASLFAPEPPVTASIKTLKGAFIEPLYDFFKRKHIFEVITFIIFYKMDVVLALALMTPFMMELGFSKTDIGAVTKGFGFIANLVGTFIGGIAISHISIKHCLWWFGILQGVSGLCFYFLAQKGHYYPLMVASIAIENGCSGMGNAAYSAFLMSLCNPRFTATQFALLTSLMVLTRTFIGAPAGWLVKTVGWEHYFMISILLMLPSLLLLTRFDIWIKPPLVNKET